MANSPALLVPRFFEQGAKRQDDDELLALGSEEIINLSLDAFPGGSSVNTTSTGDSAGSVAKTPTSRTSMSRCKKTSVGHVQARVWAGQVNLDVGVRFGLSLSQGNRRVMEDTATFMADACGLRRKGLERQRSDDLAATSSAATTTTTATTTSAMPAGGAANTPTAHAAAYFGVYDGHGGPEVAMYLEEVLHNHVLDDPLFPSDIPKAITNACLATDLECLEASRRKHFMGTEEEPGKEPAQEDNSLKKQMTKQDYSGAVAVMAIIHRPPAGDQHLPAYLGNISPSADRKALTGGGAAPTTAAAAAAATPASPVGTCDTPIPAPNPPQPQHQQHGDHRPVFLHVANVGDCRGVLCRGGAAVVVTQDHTPSVPCEAARVEAAGGFVSRGRVNGILGVSRSFGDIHCKVYPPLEGNDLWEGQQIISRPDVHSIQLTKADNFLILACDGVWDVLSNQEAVSYVHRRLLTHRDVQRAAVELVNKAIETSGDNCSCIVICLNQHTSHRKQRSSRASLSSASSGGSSEVVAPR